MSAAFIPLFIALLLGTPLLRVVAQQDAPELDLQTPPDLQAPPGLQAPHTAAILSPQPGQALQGSVPILGHTAVEGFRSAELSFAYYSDPRDTWFIIREMDVPVANGELADWDTTTLTDGEYTLRLVVRTDQGEPSVVTVPGLRVRNYTPVETATPPPQPSPVPKVTAAPGVAPTGTPTLVPLPPAGAALPPNPAEISPAQISESIAKGVLGVLAAFILLAAYSGVRQLLRWRRERG